MSIEHDEGYLHSEAVDCTDGPYITQDDLIRFAREYHEHMSAKESEQLANKVADKLFINRSGDKAQRLVLELESGFNGGGWRKSAVIDVVKSIAGGGK